MIVLSINALAYIFWFVLVYRKERTLTLYSSLIALIAIIACVGVYTIYKGIWFETFGDYNLDELSLEPYLYIFIGFVLLFLPLKVIKNVVISNNVFESPKFKYFLRIWLCCVSIYTLVRLTEMFAALSIGLGEVYGMRHIYGEELSFMQYANPFIGKLIWLDELIVKSTSPAMMLYSFFLFNKEEKKLPVIILLFTFLPDIIYAIALGSRGSMVWGLFKAFFIFVLMKEKMSNEIKKKIIIVIAISFSLVVVNSIVTTNERLENSKTEQKTDSSILRYFGEPFPNAFFLFWDKVKLHPMGDRLFPQYVGFSKNTGKSATEKFDYWSTKTGVPNYNWKIFYIDCYIEFGKIGAFIFIGFICLLFYWFFKKYAITVYTIPILFAYYELCDSSFTGCNLFSEQINTKIISIMIVNAILYYIWKREKKTIN